MYLHTEKHLLFDAFESMVTALMALYIKRVDFVLYTIVSNVGKACFLTNSWSILDAIIA